jgi:hypothetical protein
MRLDSCSIFIIEVEMESLISKHWSRFKVVGTFVIYIIVHHDLTSYQDTSLKIIREIYCDQCEIDHIGIIKHLFDRKIASSDVDQIRYIKNQVNFIHGWLLLKDKLKKYMKTKYDLDSFLEYDELIFFR